MPFMFSRFVGLCQSNRSIFTSVVYQMPKRVKRETAPSEANVSEPITEKGGYVYIKIHAKPGAKHNCVTDIGEEVGIQISAPPVDGEANTELVKFLAKVLCLKKSQVALDKGSKSRNKIVQVSGLNKEEVLKLLKTESEQT